MSYQVLARKWRPQNFTEMVGQHHVLRALVNAIDNEQLHHAYLFTGTRGVGKTSIARILAKCLNCETGITSKPCGTCSSCCDIRDGKFVDLIEVDAASRTKVEQTRELLDNIAYAPTRGRFKIYIIDEVHMLSMSSFNALLKTLEEPPSHVKFFLATTDEERLPMTVLSRCLRFHLKSMPVEMISTHLATILTQEKITFTKDALDLLAAGAQGSMRDALSLLDQAIAYGAGQITAADMRELLGYIDPQIIFKLLQALQQQQGAVIFTTVETILSQGLDPLTVLDDLIAAFHQIARMQIVPQSQAPAELQSFAKQFSPEEVQVFYQIALNGRRDLPWQSNIRLGLEMVLLRLLAFLPKSIETIETKIASKPPAQVAPPARVETPVIERPVAQAPVVQTPIAQAPVAPSGSQTWAQIVPQLQLTGLSHSLASHCVIKSDKTDQWQLSLAPQHAPLLTGSAVTRIEQALVRYLARNITLKVHLEDVQEETLAVQQVRQQQENQVAAVEAINTDPQVQAMMSQFGASVVAASVAARDLTE